MLSGYHMCDSALVDRLVVRGREASSKRPRATTEGYVYSLEKGVWRRDD
jgi:hypothetical protein